MVKRQEGKTPNALAFGILVEHRGLEPLTPTLPVLCAPNCANAPFRVKPRHSDIKFENARHTIDTRVQALPSGKGETVKAEHFIEG